VATCGKCKVQDSVDLGNAQTDALLHFILKSASPERDEVIEATACTASARQGNGIGARHSKYRSGQNSLRLDDGFRQVFAANYTFNLLIKKSSAATCLKPVRKETHVPKGADTK